MKTFQVHMLARVETAEFDIDTQPWSPEQAGERGEAMLETRRPGISGHIRIGDAEPEKLEICDVWIASVFPNAGECIAKVSFETLPYTALVEATSEQEARETAESDYGAGHCRATFKSVNDARPRDLYLEVEAEGVDEVDD